MSTKWRSVHWNLDFLNVTLRIAKFVKFVILFFVEKALKTQLGSAKGQLIAHQCDVADNAAVIETFAWIEKEFGGVNVLINNAGITR